MKVATKIDIFWFFLLRIDGTDIIFNSESLLKKSKKKFDKGFEIFEGWRDKVDIFLNVRSHRIDGIDVTLNSRLFLKKSKKNHFFVNYFHFFRCVGSQFILFSIKDDMKIFMMP